MPAENFKYMTKMFHLALPKNEIIMGNYRCTLLNWGRILPTIWNNAYHSHCFFEACYSYEGGGLYINGNQSYQVNSGEWCFARPGESHQMLSSEEANWGIFCMCFSLIPITGQQYQEDEESNDMLVDFFLKTKKRTASGEVRTESICEMLSMELTMQQTGFDKAISGLYATLMIDLLRAFYEKACNHDKSFIAHYGETEEIRIQKAIRYIENNIDKQLTIKDIAESIFLSERQLNRIFKKVFSSSPLQVINQIRITLAMQMLSGTILSIKEISHHCGFSSERYFMNSFRKHTGMTAGQFRKNCNRDLPENFPPINSLEA